MAHHHGAELNARVTLESLISIGRGVIREGGGVDAIPWRPAAWEDLPRMRSAAPPVLTEGVTVQ